MALEKTIQTKIDPNRAAFKYLELVVAGIGVSLISGLFSGPWWLKVVVLFIMATVGLLAFGLMPGGWLRREVHGGSRAARWIGLLLIVAYLPACFTFIALSPSGFITAFVPMVLFTLLVALVGWQTLRGAKSAVMISVSITTLLLGAGVIILGATLWSASHSTGSAGVVLLGVGLTMTGLGEWRRGPLMRGIGVCLQGIGIGVMGFDIWSKSGSMLGLGMLVGGVGWMLLGAGMVLPEKVSLLFVMLGLLCIPVSGITMLLLGARVWQAGEAMWGTSAALAGTGVLVFFGSIWHKGKFLLGVSSAFTGLSLVAAAGSFWQDGVAFVSVISALAGLALLVDGVIVTFRGLRREEDRSKPSLFRKILDYMRERDDKALGQSHAR